MTVRNCVLTQESLFSVCYKSLVCHYSVVRIAAAVYETLRPVLDEIRADLTGIRGNLTDIRGNLTGIRGNLTDIRENLTDIRENLTDIRGNLTDIKGNLTDIRKNLTDIRENLTDIRENLTRLESTIDTLSDQVEEHGDTTDLEFATSHSSLLVLNNSLIQALADVKESVRSSGVEPLLSSMNTSITEQLTAVESLVEAHNYHTVSGLAGLTSGHGTIHSNLNSLNSEHDLLNAKLTTITSDLESVKRDLKKTLEAHPYQCGGTFGWRRVVYLNMTDPNSHCPSGWRFVTYSSKRLCGRVSSDRLTCDSVIFPVTGGDYTSVCGSIRAYQVGPTDAFESYHDGRTTTIDSAYVSGVSLTHGSPRQHIWTFAAGYSEDRPSRDDACPCDASINIRTPPFVGGDYFCESGANSGPYSGFYPDDPLWDGSGCTSSSSCCSFNNPPYFTKQLSNPTSDDIEVRLCRWQGNAEDSPVEFIKLYVK